MVVELRSEGLAQRQLLEASAGVGAKPVAAPSEASGAGIFSSWSFAWRQLRPPLAPHSSASVGRGGCAGGVAGSELSGAPQALGKGAELGEMDGRTAPLCLSQGPFCEEALASAQPQRSRVNGARVASQPQRFPSRLARPSAPSAGVPAAFTFELNSAGVRCAPRIPGLCPRQQKTRQAGDPRSGGYPPPLDPGSGAQPGAQHCGTCGGRDLPPPGGRKTRGSRPHRSGSGALPSPRPGACRPAACRPRGEQRPWPCASASPPQPS